MSWFSEKHKKIYSKALNALYEDTKNLSGNILDVTKKSVVTGYEKIKNGVEYLDKQYHDTSPDPIHISSSPSSSFNVNTNTNSNNTNNRKDKPDVLVYLNKKQAYISKIYIMDGLEKRLIIGKISSYDYINEIIHKWFIYKNRSSDHDQIHKNRSSDHDQIHNNNLGWKWYPTNELYTLCSIPDGLNTILFTYKEDGYTPKQVQVFKSSL